MTTVPILAMFDFSKEFIVEMDVSGKGLDVVLMQEGRPITYISKAFSIWTQGKSVYKQELIAVMMTFQKRRHYLLRRHFKVRMDQRSLQYLTNQKVISND